MRLGSPGLWWPPSAVTWVEGEPVSVRGSAA